MAANDPQAPSIPGSSAESPAGWDPVWEKVFSSQAWGKYPGEDLIRFVARNFYKAPDRKAVRILEVGSGPGANLWFVAREGFSAYGIEGSATAVAQSIKRLDDEVGGWSGKIVQGDFNRLPFADAEFDAVIDIEAIYCNAFENSRRIIAGIRRVLKPRGLFYSRTFAQGCMGDGTGEPVGHHAWKVAEGPLLGKGYSRFSDADDIERLYGEGFTIEELELNSRTVGGHRSGHHVIEWSVTARKV